MNTVLSFFSFSQQNAKLHIFVHLWETDSLGITKMLLFGFVISHWGKKIETINFQLKTDFVWILLQWLVLEYFQNYQLISYSPLKIYWYPGEVSSVGSEPKLGSGRIGFGLAQLSMPSKELSLGWLAISCKKARFSSACLMILKNRVTLKNKNLSWFPTFCQFFKV